MTCSKLAGRVALALSLPVLAACGGSSNVSSDGANENAADYTGSWRTGCVQEPIAENTYFQYGLTLGSTDWEYVIATYLDEACTVQMSGTEDTGISIRATITASGSYTDKGEVTTADGLAAAVVDLTLENYTSTLDEDDAESDANIGTTEEGFLYVSDTDQLFAGGDAFFSPDVSTSQLRLDLPFTRQQTEE